VRIVIRPLLVSGMLGTEPATESVILFIDSGQTEEQQTIAFWHEMLHAALGPPWIGHPEDWIEEKAKALAKAFPDVWQVVKARQESVGVEGDPVRP
jgi:hypothetical protein